MKRIFTLISAVSVSVLPVAAIAATLSAPGASKTLQLPASAGNSPVISLGSAIDPQTGNLVEGYAIVHYGDAQARVGAASRGKQPACYSFMAKGARWKVAEPWVVNPANARGLDTTLVASNFAGDIAKWENAADGVIDAGSLNIVGDGTVTADVLAADSVSPDGQNEVLFGAISDANAIAVTIVWGIFSGPTFARELVEWDQVYDDTDYDWSLAGEAGKMDFENIATHELGHTFGLRDMYDASCAVQTMYGYADFGETNKRTLESGDIKGISELY